MLRVTNAPGIQESDTMLKSHICCQPNSPMWLENISSIVIGAAVANPSTLAASSKWSSSSLFTAPREDGGPPKPDMSRKFQVRYNYILCCRWALICEAVRSYKQACGSKATQLCSTRTHSENCQGKDRSGPPENAVYCACVVCTW